MTVAPASTRLLLVRHGETEWNVERRFQGHRDSPLTNRGLWQARQLATRLSTVSNAAIYASDLERTLVTARSVAEPLGLPIEPVAAFREANFGAYEGNTLTELEAMHGDAVRRWADDPLTIAPPDGETLLALQERVAGLIRDLVARHAGQTVILVGHGGSVRAAVIDVLGMDPRRFRSLRMDNASLTIIEASPEFQALVLFNDVSHLSQ